MGDDSRNDDSRRVMVVTGAGSGIGAAVCRRVARPGVAIVAHTRTNKDGLEAVAADARAAGAEVDTALGDLRDGSATHDLVDRAKARFGGLDHLVSNHGFADRRPIGKFNAADLQDSLTSMVGTFLELCSRALPLIEKSDHGRVVVVSGLAAHSFRLGGLGFGATAAAKGGVEALAKTLAIQLAPSGATVNCVVPGFIRTRAGLYGDDDPQGRRYAAQLVPLGRLGQPQEIAEAITFLLSERAAYITGQVLQVNGGLNL